MTSRTDQPVDQATKKSKTPRTNVTGVVDVVLLTLKNAELHVALFKRDNPDEPAHGMWALPGGFVRTEQDVDVLATAERVLRDKAGLESPFLEQLQAFSGAARDPERLWTICVAYYALVPLEQIESSKRGEMKLMSVRSLRGLPFDHKEIIETAVERVRSKSGYSSLPAYLCDSEFTLPELHAVYKVLRGNDKDNLASWRKKFEEVMDEAGIEMVPGKKRPVGRGKPAQLYRISKRSFGTVATRDRGVSG